MSVPFRVKICGITQAKDASAAASAGADAIGLNFYSPSPRSVDAKAAMAIPIIGGVSRVGVFVNHSATEIVDIAEECSLDFIQLHGDETPVFAEALDGCLLIPVIRVRDSHDLDSVKRRLDLWLAANCQIAALLLDASVGSDYGGTGHLLDWEMAAKAVEYCPSPIILAGGLNAENVASAIERVRPEAIDVASGVEQTPGAKSHSLMAAFIESARASF